MTRDRTPIETPAIPRPALREIRNVRNAQGDIVGRVESLADGRFRASWSVQGAWGSAMLNSMAAATHKIRVEIRRANPGAAGQQTRDPGEAD